MKPTQSILILLSLFLISNCGDKVREEIKELLDEVLEDYINQVAVMSDTELVYDRNDFMKTTGREKYDDEELEKHSQIHTITIQLEQIRRFSAIVYDYEK